MFGLLGPNGAGKSTTIGMLNTTIRPTGGSARLAGYDVQADPIARPAGQQRGVPGPGLDKALTGRRNLTCTRGCGASRGRPRPARSPSWPDVSGVGEVIDRPVASYSGGQRRRLEIARALVSEPRVLFLDEPTVGLDTRIRYELLDLIAALRGRTGMTALLTTHYLDEAERLCDRHRGHARGRRSWPWTPGRAARRLGAELVELRVGKEPDGALAAMRAHGLAAATRSPSARRSPSPSAAAPPGTPSPPSTSLGIRTEAVTTRKPTLDDVYLRLTGTGSLPDPDTTPGEPR